MAARAPWSLPNTMKGIYISSFSQPYTFRTDLPIPKITNPKNMLVKITCAGFCHTELMALNGDFGGSPGFVPGHEPAGVVVALGDEVSRLNIGDRVGCGLFRDYCGECRECKRGTTNYCAHARLGGLTVDGGMAEYYLASSKWAVKLPDGMDDAAAASLMCAGSTIYNSILKAKQPTGAILAIVGLGGLGHLGVQFAKAKGYKVVAVDTREAPVELIKTLPERLSPDLFLNPTLDDRETALKKIAETFPGATGIDAALVATDAVPAFAWAKSVMAKHGTLVFIGQPAENVPFHYTDFVAMDLTIVAGCLGQPRVVQEMVDLVVREGILVHTTRYKPDEIAKLVEDYHKPGVKGKLVVSFE